MKSHTAAQCVLALGDLADDGQAANLQAVRDAFRSLPMPLYPVPGNHDYATATDRQAYEATFPDRINYRFELNGWQFLGLDSTQGTDYEKTRVSPATLAWLDATLPALDRRQPMIVFTHFPLGSDVPMRPLNADEVLRRLAGFNVQGIFGGHHHALTVRAFENADVVTNRCCSRLRGNHDGSKEKGYWRVTADGGRLSREFVEFKPPAA
jgi:3',5'-cyclic AMP phosphodiesterase CpdA